MTRETSTRRTLLAGLAGLGAGLAGCTGSTGPSSPSADDSGTAIENVAVDGFTLVITLAESASVDRLNVIAPDGSEFASTEVVEGQTRVEFEIEATYTPGEYQVVSNSGDQVTLNLRPDVEISGVGVGANYQQMMPESLDNAQKTEAWVRVENRGTGPAVISDLAFKGDLPNPTDDVLDEPATSGIFDAETGKGELPSVRICPDAEVLLFSSTLPFTFEGEGADCRGTSYSSEFSVILGFSGTPERVERTFGVSYSGSEKYYDCSVESEPL